MAEKGSDHKSQKFSTLSQILNERASYLFPVTNEKSRCEDGCEYKRSVPKHSQINYNESKLWLNGFGIYCMTFDLLQPEKFYRTPVHHCRLGWQVGFPNIIRLVYWKFTAERQTIAPKNSAWQLAWVFQSWHLPQYVFTKRQHITDLAWWGCLMPKPCSASWQIPCKNWPKESLTKRLSGCVIVTFLIAPAWPMERATNSMGLEIRNPHGWVTRW